MAESVLRMAPQLPDPGRGWIAYAPSRWLSCDRLWIDLAGARLAAGAHETVAPPQDTVSPVGDALVYVPPVALIHRATRDALIRRLVARAIPVVAQLSPGELPETDSVDAAGVSYVYDLSGPLLAGEMGRLSLLPEDAWVLWPLFPGISDDETMIDEGCRALAEAQVRIAQPITLEIQPALAQQLASGRPASVFDALFHSEPPSERPFAIAASARGLSVWPPRPETGATPRMRSNRRLAAAVALAAELWLRLERPLAAGQALYRAARGVETSDLDLAAVIREGNVHVLDFVDDRAADLLRELCEGGESKLLRELRVAYVGAS